MEVGYWHGTTPLQLFLVVGAFTPKQFTKNMLAAIAISTGSSADIDRLKATVL